MVRLIQLQIDGSSVSVASGTRVLDALDDHPQLGLPVSCRSAHCGTCHVMLESPPEGVAPPTESERETLAELGRSGGRLACQLVITGETDRVVLRRDAWPPQTGTGRP